jgi:hypothetical protein
MEVLAPDLMGKVIGFRNWKAYFEEDGSYNLRGEYYSRGLWQPGVNRAVCLYSDPLIRTLRACDSPGNECRCGLYAMHDLQNTMGRLDLTEMEMFKEPRTYISVSGIIQAWGKMELYQDGFRAEYATPIALITPNWTRLKMYNEEYMGFLRDISERYQMEVVSFEEAEAWASARGGKVPVSMRPQEQVYDRLNNRRPRTTTTGLADVTYPTKLLGQGDVTIYKTDEGAAQLTQLFDELHKGSNQKSLKRRLGKWLGF